MVRTVKEYAVRRNDILDAARRLVFAKGYEQMTIQDILGELQIAKGTFYHYFGSKHALLEALVERMLREMEELLLPVVQDPQLPALAKLQRVFDTIGGWKTAQKDYHLVLLRVWYADDNAIVRWKVRTKRVERLGPLFAAIIRQGEEEEVLYTPDPGRLSEVVLALTQDFMDTLAALFLSFEPGRDDLLGMVDATTVYTGALERVLGIPTGSLSLVDAATLEEWVNSFVDADVRSDARTEGNSER